MRQNAVPTRGRPGGPPFVLLYLLSAGLGTLGVGLAAVSIAPGVTVSILEQIRGNPGESGDADRRPPSL